MACTDQASIRNPNTNISTVLSGLQLLSYQSTLIGLNAAQSAAADRLINPSETALMFNSVNGLQSAALKAQDSLFIIISPGLPDNQWQIELQGWFDTALAQMQSAVVEFIAKDIDGFSPYANLTYGSDAGTVQRMCDNQIILATGSYQSISLMGVEIIVIGGIVILLFSFFLENLVGCCQARCCGGKRQYKRVSWVTDSVLQQQRLATELAGVRKDDWEKIDGEVPVTLEGKKWRSEPLMDHFAKQ
jgi:hypothetical protein